MAYLEISSVNAHGGLRHTDLGDPRDEQAPDLFVLRHGQRPQCAIERATRLGDQLLLHQEGAVLDPNAGHLVKEA
jgi:hypothetical protein